MRFWEKFYSLNALLSGIFVVDLFCAIEAQNEATKKMSILSNLLNFN